jgi:HSP20 family molecular chaperone IbpA
MFFKDFNEVYEVFKNLEAKSQCININNDCNVFVNDEVLYIQVPAVGIEKEDINIELNDNILLIKGEISKEAEKVDKTIKSGFKLGNIESKVKLSQKYNDGSFDVKVEKGLIQIKITPKEKETNFKKIF